MSDHGSADSTTRHDVVAGVEALNLTGLGFATKRLLGKDPGRVTGQFVMWSRQELAGLPALTSAYWTALSPLGIERPPLESAALCERLLRGGRTSEEVAAAANECIEVGKERFGRVRPPADGASATARHDELIKAVKEYWRALAAIYGEVRSRVVTGEHDRAVRLIRRADVVLAEILGRVEVAAAGVAGQVPAPRDQVPSPTGEAPAPTGEMSAVGADEVPQPGDQPATEQLRRPLGTVQDQETRAEAFAQSRRVSAEPEAPAPRPVEVLSTRPVRNRPFAPVLFLLLVAGLALFVIFSVLNAPNPLTQ